MESQIWMKTEDKLATILMLRGPELYRLKVTGNMLTLKRNVKRVMEALEQGKPPAEAGAKSLETLDARTIRKAEVSPGKDSLTVHGGEDGSTKLSYATGEKNADTILRVILDQSGQSFETSTEEIGVVEALLPPVIFGAIGGLFWFGLYYTAGQIAAGEVVEAKSGRRRGLQQLMITAAQVLGVGGTIAVGVLLLALVVGWAANRIIRRPERAVWLPRTA